jgi:hypothetical protein
VSSIPLHRAKDERESEAELVFVWVSVEEKWKLYTIFKKEKQIATSLR